MHRSKLSQENKGQKVIAWQGEVRNDLWSQYTVKNRQCSLEEWVPVCLPKTGLSSVPQGCHCSLWHSICLARCSKLEYSWWLQKRAPQPGAFLYAGSPGSRCWVPLQWGSTTSHVRGGERENCQHPLCPVPPYPMLLMSWIISCTVFLFKNWETGGDGTGRGVSITVGWSKGCWSAGEHDLQCITRA